MSLNNHYVIASVKMFFIHDMKLLEPNSRDISCYPGIPVMEDNVFIL